MWKLRCRTGWAPRPPPGNAASNGLPLLPMAAGRLSNARLAAGRRKRRQAGSGARHRRSAPSFRQSRSTSPRPAIPELSSLPPSRASRTTRRKPTHGVALGEQLASLLDYLLAGKEIHDFLGSVPPIEEQQLAGSRAGTPALKAREHRHCG